MGDEIWDDDGMPSVVASNINRQRQATYGDPTPNMEMFAGLLSAYFGIDVSAEDASMVMVLVKIMREKRGGFRPDYHDNRDDMCGWTNVLHQVVKSHAG